MFLKLGPRKHDFPLATLIPNLLTTLALCSGLAALHYTLKGNWDRALLSVVLSGIFDALDGRAARLLRVSSDFGAVLDSLSDFLGFGVAPAMILKQWLAEDHRALGENHVMDGPLNAMALAAFMTYALCAALRLARFTAEPSPPKAATPGMPVIEAPRVAQRFTGMPSPAGAGVVLIPVFLAQSNTIAWRMPPWGVIALAFFVGLLMVSRVPMFSLKALRVTRRGVAPLLVCVGLIAAAMLYDPPLTMAGIACLYVLTIPFVIFRWLTERRKTNAARLVAGA